MNIIKDANRWSNMAIPPGGTGFNPNYMSTPPPGLERSFINFIPPGVTRFDLRYMSTPPPNSVYVGSHITGGAPYTGGSYIAPPIIQSVPTGIINNYQRQLQLQRDLQQFNIPKTPIIDTFKNYHSPNIMHQFPNIDRIYNPPPEINTNIIPTYTPPPMYNPPPVYTPPPTYTPPPVYTPSPIYVPPIHKY